ncbi:MAG: hypothetical protein JHC31_14420 [Sulfurihydrogenibium sp.]|nr:hypothetical protein [Sulfurihydrogenibium sp.]
MNFIMTVKAEDLYEALKEIEELNSFEMIYLRIEAGAFNLEAFIDEDTDEWYEGDRYSVIEANFNKFWLPFADAEELLYIKSFIQSSYQNDEFIEIEYNVDSLKLRTWKITLTIERK